MEVNEQIDIYTIIKKGKLRPIAFAWKGKKYLIDKINLVYTQKEGMFPVYFFSVSVQDTLYKISISLRSNVCTLCEIYTE